MHRDRTLYKEKLSFRDVEHAENNWGRCRERPVHTELRIYEGSTTFDPLTGSGRRFRLLTCLLCQPANDLDAIMLKNFVLVRGIGEFTGEILPWKV